MEWLLGQGMVQPADLLAQARGAPLEALRLANADYQSERTVWLGALAAPPTLDAIELASRIDRAPRDLRKALLGAAIDWLTAWCADLAAVQGGGAPLRARGAHAAALAALAKTVAPLPLVIGTTSLPSGTVGTAYSATLTASGGTPPFTWTQVSGALAPGLTLSVQERKIIARNQLFPVTHRRQDIYSSRSGVINLSGDPLGAREQ